MHTIRHLAAPDHEQVLAIYNHYVRETYATF